ACERQLHPRRKQRPLGSKGREGTRRLGGREARAQSQRSQKKRSDPSEAPCPHSAAAASRRQLASPRFAAVKEVSPKRASSFPPLAWLAARWAKLHAAPPAAVGSARW